MNKLSEDTEVILLLCCRLPANVAASELAKPLSHQEYVTLAKWLLRRGLSPKDLLGQRFSQHSEALEQADFDIKRLRNLLGRGVLLSFALERWDRSGIWILSRADATYPKRFKRILGQKAPAILYGAGNADALDTGGLGVVGSRDISPDVEEFVSRLARDSAMQGVNIVSGGARGVDTIAMRSAARAGGSVIGILADGLARSITTKSSREAITAGKLTLISPYTPEAGFNAGNAMSRNKLIYAASDAVLVAQAEKDRGGTWSGAIESLCNAWSPVLVQTEYPSDGLDALCERGAQPFAYENKNSIVDYLHSLRISENQAAVQVQLL